MTVLVEAYSVLVRVDAIKTSLIGGLSRFTELVPNQTHCSDGVLCRVGFMVLEDASFFTNQLFGEGLEPATDELIESPDIALASQSGSMVFPCSWIELAQFDIFGDARLVWGASLRSEPTNQFSCPPDWNYENYQSLEFVPIGSVEDVTGSGGVTREVVDEEGRTRFVGRPYNATGGLPN